MRKNESKLFIPHPASGHKYNQYPSEMVLRAQLNERQLGEIKTTEGTFELTELDVVGLEPDSRQKLDTLSEEWAETREARAHKLGVEAIRDIVIPSPLAVYGAMLDGYDPYPEDPSKPLLGYSALVKRDKNSGRIKGARGIHIPVPHGKPPRHNPKVIQQYRTPLLNQTEPLPIVNQSQDRELHRKGQHKLPTELPTEPNFDWKYAGHLPDGTAVDRVNLGSIARPPAADRITIVHSRSLMDTWQYGIDPETYAHMVTPRGMERDPETGQQTQAFDRLTVFSARTLARLSKIRSSH